MAKTKKTKTKDQSEQTPFEASVAQTAIEQPKYTEKEASYRGFLLRLLEHDRDVREQPHDEFNGMTYTQRYIQNFKAGNSYSPPRKNPEDTSVVTGTTREKKLAVINSVVNLVIDTTFRAFDNDNVEDQELGEAMTDCVFQSNQIEQWDEKKIFAYSELADQGDVFIEDNWIDETRLDKKKIKISSLTDESFKDFDAEKSLKVIFSGARRNVIPGPQVFLGNIRCYDIKKQPRIFTGDVISYEEAKSIYGTLPRFKYVPRSLTPVDERDTERYGYNWRLGDIADGMVEVIKYQDKFNDEYQILLNGVMMFPVGFPMPWEHGEYNIVQGHLEPISAFFAYSKSIPDKSALDQQVLDEQLRLMILKNQKSFAPPIANYSANILTKNMFLPGKVNNNLEKGEVEVLGGNPNMYAVQQSEFEMFKLMKGLIDEKSISPALQGQAFGSRTTATEVDTVMAQAKQQLGIMIFGFTNLHLQLDFLRLHILLENYTKEQGDKVNEMTGRLERKFRSVTVERDIGGRGLGNKQIDFTETPATPEDLYNKEEGITPNPEGGRPLSVNPPKKPMRILQIKPSTLRSIKWRWYPEVSINERESSLADRISWEDRITRAAQLFGLENLNMEYIKQQWAVKNKMNPSYVFNPNPVPPVDPLAAQAEIDAAEQSPVSKKAQSKPTGTQEAVRQGYGG